MSSYDVRAVANYYLRKSWEEEIDIDPMKLQKLVFLAHGWNLGIHGRPLVKQPVEAWQYGPVFYDLYREFRDFGRAPIDHLAGAPGARDSLPDYDQESRQVLDMVWDRHKGFSGSDLSAMTHQAGTPWHRVSEKFDGRIPRNENIPNSLIREHYQRRVHRDEST